ncbi:MAG: alpha/beta hydrolase [Sphingomonadaceae bacterium]|nr:alpha/beta hydrolase [Sphingomonadaceae bacterium]
MRATAVLIAGCLLAPPSRAAPAPPGPPWPGARPITLVAADGVRVVGWRQAPANPRALVLLFHQAGSSSAEYAAIAPRLVAGGLAVLAIDQRSGGGLFGANLTVDRLGGSRDYLEAGADLEAAIGWGQRQASRIVLWGSSYSSSLVLMAAAKRPLGLAAVLSFSPGEYFGDTPIVRRAAARVRVPTLVYAAPDDETVRARPIAAALQPPAPVTSCANGIHGSSTLIPERNPRGWRGCWAPVMAFLARVLAAPEPGRAIAKRQPMLGR